jgi:hypothetical protein
MITFTEPADEDDEIFRNNLSFYDSDRPTEKSIEAKNWDWVIYMMLPVKAGVGAAMLWDMERQTAYNKVDLTNFDPSNDYSTYSVVAAGTTNPLYCLVIAISLVIFSVIIGLTSSKKYMLSTCYSVTLLVVLMSLQVIALSLHITMLAKEEGDLRWDCLTNTSMFALHIVTFALSVLGLVLLAMAPQSKQAKRTEPKREFIKNRVNMTDGVLTIEPKDKNFDGVNTPQDKKDYDAYLRIINLTHEDIYRETTGNFWLCVVEDLNTILCYAFVVRACDAQSSIHDDSTTFFDVLCIVFLGFLQHVANILMIFHAHIEKQTELQKRGKDKKTQDEMDTQVEQLMTFIARTRLLLFFMIGVTVVFFYLRIAPTYEEFEIAIPYEIVRVLALIVMVSLNTFHSFWFEIQNAYNRKKTWDTSPTWKLGTLAFVALVFSIMLLVNTTFDKDEHTRYELHNLKPSPGKWVKMPTTTPPPGATFTPVPTK